MAGQYTVQDRSPVAEEMEEDHTGYGGVQTTSEPHSAQRTLLAGPWLGEFGWEVMVWVPMVRAKSEGYDETVVVCRSGHGFLYEDFASKVEYSNRKGTPDRWYLNGKDVQMPKRYLRGYRYAKLWRPRRSKCLKARRKYIEYGNIVEELAYDLVIHARATDKNGQSNQNWAKENYVKVIKSLGNIKVCSVGTEAYHIPGTDDRRNMPLKDLCDLMRSSKLMISPSSGPAHLAQLCGLSLIVWTHAKYLHYIKMTNRTRYKKAWHPFDVPVKVIDKYGWHPPVEAVVNAVKKRV